MIRGSVLKVFGLDEYLQFSVRKDGRCWTEHCQVTSSVCLSSFNFDSTTSSEYCCQTCCSVEIRAHLVLCWLACRWCAARAAVSIECLPTLWKK